MFPPRHRCRQLLKYCHWVEDTQGYSMELRNLRDTDKREVDFVVLKDGKLTVVPFIRLCEELGLP